MGLLSWLTGRPSIQVTAADVVPAPAATPTDANVNAVDGLQNLVTGMGTSRSKGYYSGYVSVVPRSKQQLDAAYEGSWLAAKIVDVPAGDMTREWVDLSWDGYDKDINGAKAIETAEARLDVRGKFKDAITWARLYGGSVVIPGIKGDEDWSQPLDVTKVKKGTLESLTVFDRHEIQGTTEIEEDVRSPNFGLPIYYTLSSSLAMVRVHWTRVIRFSGGRRLPRQSWINNGRWDASVLHGGVLDAITNYDSTRESAAEMMSESVVAIIKTSKLFEAVGKQGEATIQSRFQAAAIMKSVFRVTVLDKDREDYEQHSMAFGGVTDVMGKFELDVSGAADIPITRLFGQSPAGMSATGESDIRNYYDKIKADQQRILRPPLEMLYQILVRSELGAMPENFCIEFNPLWQASEKEVADVEKVRADRDAIYIGQKVATAGMVARELHDRGTYRTMEEEDVELAEDDEDGGEDDDHPTDSATLEDETVTVGDSLPGDMIKHDDDGWHAYAGDKHVGGPYKRHGIALRRLRKFDRSYRK